MGGWEFLSDFDIHPHTPAKIAGAVTRLMNYGTVELWAIASSCALSRDYRATANDVYSQNTYDIVGGRGNKKIYCIFILSPIYDGRNFVGFSKVSKFTETTQISLQFLPRYSTTGLSPSKT